jgi:hypothetical protein
MSLGHQRLSISNRPQLTKGNTHASLISVLALYIFYPVTLQTQKASHGLILLKSQQFVTISHKAKGNEHLQYL